MAKMTQEMQEMFNRASVKQLALLAGPFAAGYAVHYVILFVDRAMATTLGVGNAAVLNYAYRMALVIGQLSGLAVSTAMFPRLAEQVTNNDTAGARSSLASALRFVWMVGFPATCGLILLREPLVRVLFERGAFDSAATAAVSAPLANLDYARTSPSASVLKGSAEDGEMDSSRMRARFGRFRRI